MTDKKDLTAASPGSARAMVDSFLDQTKRVPAVTNTTARLVFALDATMSRQPTWDLACRVQGEMFDATAAIGAWPFSWCTFAASTSAGPRIGWSSPAPSTNLMSRIECRGGQTQIGRVLRHVAGRGAPVFGAGRGFRRRRDGGTGRRTLRERPGNSASLGVKAFMFHEGRDPAAARPSRKSRGSPRGAYARFDAGAANALRRPVARRRGLCGEGGRRHDAIGSRPERSGPRPPHSDERAVPMTLLYGAASRRAHMVALQQVHPDERRGDGESHEGRRRHVALGAARPRRDCAGVSTWRSCSGAPRPGSWAGAPFPFCRPSQDGLVRRPAASLASARP